MLIFLPFILLAAIFAPSEGPGGVSPFLLVFVVFLYPLMGLVMGWISGLLTSAIYNLIIRWSGGLLLDFDSLSPGSGIGPA